MKITVYAIALNEAKFARRWMESMKEADAVVVLDTGSTDDTASILRECGATVAETKYERWESFAEYDRIVAAGGKPHRFDRERNESLALVPPDTDICVCTDLDEFFLPGWRAKLEAAWTEAVGRGCKPTTGCYEYVWNFNADGSDGSKFTYKKIHAYGVAKWTHPVHEILDYGSAARSEVYIPGVRLEHHADDGKSRRSYLTLLELSVREAPNDDRNAHYLGREYMFNGMWNEAIEHLKRHLTMPNATWRPERAASMRYIGKCHRKLGDNESAVEWLTRAIEEAPDKREAAVELAQLAYDRASELEESGDPAARMWWSLCALSARRALAVTTRTQDYLTVDAYWGYKPWDLLSLGLWNIGNKRESLEAAKKALSFAPDNERLQKNVSSIEKSMYASC